MKQWSWKPEYTDHDFLLYSEKKGKEKKRPRETWWRSVSSLHHFSLTSTNRYTTCGDSIRKPLATDRLWTNCCLRGIWEWEVSIYKDKNTIWNPSTCNILYKNRKLLYTALSRSPILLQTVFISFSGIEANKAKLNWMFYISWCDQLLITCSPMTQWVITQSLLILSCL